MPASETTKNKKLVIRFMSGGFSIIIRKLMFETDFLSPYDVDESRIVKIQLSEFFINVGLDIGIFIVGILIWKYILWVPTEKMTLPNPSNGTRYLIDKGTSLMRVFKIIKAILKEMIGKGDVLIHETGF